MDTPNQDVAKKYWDDNSLCIYTNKEVFDHCFPTIRPWIDVPHLVAYLRKYGLGTDDDFDYLSRDRLTNEKRLRLIQMADRGGRNGYFILYMCLRESRTVAPAHKDVVKELEECGIQNKGLRSAIDDAEVFYAADPTGFFYGELNGKLISCVSVVKYEDKFAFVGNYIVEETHRRKGYGLSIFNHALATLSQSHNCGLDTVDKVELFEKLGFKPTWYNRRMLFDVPSCNSHLEDFSPPADVLVQPARQVDFDLLSTYDTTAFGAPHHRFLKALLKGPNCVNSAATNRNGDIIGFVSARRTILEEDGWRIGPLFADNAQIARTLLKFVFKELANNVLTRKVATMDVPYNINPDALALAEELKASLIVDFCRMFNKGPLDVPKEKVFGLVSVELG